MNSIYESEEDYRQAVMRARAMSPEEKILAGERLFREECERMKAAIRLEFPEYCEEMVASELTSRLDQAREQEERGIYVRVPMSEAQRLTYLRAHLG